MSKTKKITFKVSGMSCNGCAASIGRALTRLDGIDLAEASFEKSSAEVKYDEKQIDKQKMIDVIETLGFKVEGEL